MRTSHILIHLHLTTDLSGKYRYFKDHTAVKLWTQEIHELMLCGSRGVLPTVLDCFVHSTKHTELQGLNERQYIQKA